MDTGWLCSPPNMPITANLLDISVKPCYVSRRILAIRVLEFEMVRISKQYSLYTANRPGVSLRRPV